MNKINNKKLGVIWWSILFFISIINILIGIYFYNKTFLVNNDLNLFKLVLVYIFVCALRATFPKKDVSGVCFYDSVFSYPILGRAFATVAEICIIIFISTIYKYIANDILKNKTILFLYDLIILFVIIAQLFCWSGAITKCYLYNAIEESIWTLCAFILTILNIYLLSYDNKKYSSILKFSIIFGVIYLFYMICFDIPMYYNNFKLDKSKKLSILKGLKSMCKCTKVTKLYTDWNDEIIWQSGYFSVCVWGALYTILWYENIKKN